LTPTGHLVYQRGLALWAAPFDAERLEVVGSAAPVLDGVRAGDFAISQNGTLIYVPAEGSNVQTLTWLDDPTGNPQSAGFPSAVHGTFQTSPEGTHLAVEVAGITRDIWIYNLVTGDRERLTNQGNNGYPIWSPDGEWVAFRSDRFGPFNLFRKRASGAGDAERLTESEVDQATSHWGRPGGGEIWFTSEFTNQNDIQVLDLQTREVRTVVGGPDNQIHPTVSADGTLLAYTSSGSGYSEVYVKRLPESDEVKVSRAGGEEPVWARTENVLYYRNGFKWMRVEIGNDPRDASVAEEIFEGNYLNVGGRSYDVDSDGRFLLLKPAAVTASRINIIVNWFEELKQRVPTGR